MTTVTEKSVEPEMEVLDPDLLQEPDFNISNFVKLIRQTNYLAQTLVEVEEKSEGEKVQKLMEKTLDERGGVLIEIVTEVVKKIQAQLPPTGFVREAIARIESLEEARRYTSGSAFNRKDLGNAKDLSGWRGPSAQPYMDWRWVFLAGLNGVLPGISKCVKWAESQPGEDSITEWRYPPGMPRELEFQTINCYL